MCTVVTLSRPGHAWPLILAANRDELLSRPWQGPAAHWPDRPGVTAGRDATGGGTWMGINRAGLVAAVLNRPGSLGPAPGKRSRGELPLLALDHDDASSAARAITALDAADYRTFNMVIADRTGVIFLLGLGDGRPEAITLAPGVHMVTASDADDLASPRIARHLPRFAAATPPDPARGDWGSWESLLADRSGPPGTELNVPPHGGFGTVCSSLLALPASGAPIWLFAAGAPDEVPFQAVV